MSRLYHHQKLIIVAFLSLSIPRKEDAAKLKSESEKGLAAGFLPGPWFSNVQRLAGGTLSQGEKARIFSWGEAVLGIVGTCCFTLDE